MLLKGCMWGCYFLLVMLTQNINILHIHLTNNSPSLVSKIYDFANCHSAFGIHLL